MWSLQTGCSKQVQLFRIWTFMLEMCGLLKQTVSQERFYGNSDIDSGTLPLPVLIQCSQVRQGEVISTKEQNSPWRAIPGAWIWCSSS